MKKLFNYNPLTINGCWKFKKYILKKTSLSFFQVNQLILKNETLELAFFCWPFFFLTKKQLQDKFRYKQVKNLMDILEYSSPRNIKTMVTIIVINYQYV